MNKRSDAPVGVFDSGLGGLTVMREIVRQIPDERIVYFGDTARVPYGSKSRATIIHYTEQILNFLKTKEVKAIVVACNTVSAYALEAVKDRVDVPIIGVVKPGARVAAVSTKNHKVGVIGTEATVDSGLYSEYIRHLNPKAEVFSKACPLFVPLVEEGWWHDEITTSVTERYMKELKEAGVDTLIMGCTHYPLLRSTLREVMGPEVNLVNPAYETAVELRRTLEWRDLLREEDGSEKCDRYRFYVSDASERFGRFAQSVLGFDVPAAEKINIEEF